MKSRLELPKLIKANGIALELGVATGYYSDIILANSTVKRLYSVDRWSDHHNDEEHNQTTQLLSKYVTRSVVMRMDFELALKHFIEDGTLFDFIYVDAYAHTGQQDGELLYKWYPLLKEGGIFAGHDYTERYPQTIKAVDDFCANLKNCPTMHIVKGNRRTDNVQDRYESWYIFKP